MHFELELAFLIPIIGLIKLGGGASGDEYVYFLTNFFIGLFCYFSFFSVSKVVRAEVGDKGIFLILFLPGVVHLGLFCIDLYSAHAFSISEIQNNPEVIKDIPRVGRKYLSLGLSLFLVVSLFGGAFIAGKAKWLLLFSCLPIAISLAVLDTRAAFLALAIVTMVIIVIPVFRDAMDRVFSSITSRKLYLLIYLVGVLGVSIFTSYEVGKTRWAFLLSSLDSGIRATNSASPYSGIRATNSGSPKKSSSTPWESKSFWERKCDGSTGAFRCGTDSSAYLRSSWMIYGIEGVWRHPTGIGFSREPLRALYLIDNPDIDRSDLSLRDSHSQMLDEAICFGWVGLLAYAVFFFNLISIGYKKIVGNNYSHIHMGTFVFLLVCISRFFLDSFNEGLYFFLTSVVGMFVYLTKADSVIRQTEATVNK